MSEFIVSARKYRPSTFSSVVGQDALTITLKNAIVNNKLAHAYLFCGPRGVGKTTCARIFAKTINCLNLTPNHEPCNECESCRAFNEQRSYNIHELDAASNNSVDDIRSLIDQVRILPQVGKYKVYIIDEVHMLSASAFNAFLKTLEEPPAHAIFILATTEKYKIIPTILSRCQVYDFNRITLKDIVNYLQYVAKQEQILAEPDALSIIAQKADGGMRDALSIFDQISAFTEGNITYQNVIKNLNIIDYEYYFNLTDLFLECKIPEAMLLFNDILNRGFEAQYFISGLNVHFRDLLMAHDPITLKLLENSDNIKEKYKLQSQKCSDSFLYAAIEIVNNCDLQYKQSRNKRLLVELTLIRLCQLNNGEKKKVTNSDSFDKIPIQPIFSSNTVETNVSQVVTASTSSNPSAIDLNKTVLSKTSNITVPNTPKTKELPSIPTFSIRKTEEKEKKLNIQERLKEQLKQKNDFTQKELVSVWQSFIDNNQTQHHLISIMKDFIPTRESNESISLTVYNPIDEKKIKECISLIVNFLRKQLNNDYIVLSVHLEEPDEAHRVYTPKEKFEIMLEDNPNLRILAEKLNLKII